MFSHKNNFYLFLGITLFIFSSTNSIQAKNDSTAHYARGRNLPIIMISTGYQIVGQDLTKKYGNNYKIGGLFGIISKRNLFWGLKGHYLWGGDIKVNNQFNGISNNQGFLIDSDGTPNSITRESRGSNFFLVTGKLLPIKKSKNHFILGYAGIGLSHHNINYVFSGKIPILSENYLKGLDRLSMGPAFNFHLGYIFLHNQNFFNLHAGINYIIGWEKSLRGYNIDTKKKDTNYQTIDIIELNLGIIIKLRPETKKKDEYYFY